MCYSCHNTEVRMNPIFGMGPILLRNYLGNPFAENMVAWFVKANMEHKYIHVYLKKKYFDPGEVAVMVVF